MIAPGLIIGAFVLKIKFSTGSSLELPVFFKSCLQSISKHIFQTPYTKNADFRVILSFKRVFIDLSRLI
jgi:hypothetical protein